MPKQLQAEVEVQASPERVWEVLTDFAAYSQWNPFIVQAAGQAVPGSRLELRMRLPGRRPTTFRPQVLEAEPARRLRWPGHLLVPGLIDRYTNEPAGRAGRAGPSGRRSAACWPRSCWPSSPRRPSRASTR